MSDEVNAHDERRFDLAEYVLGVLDGRARAELLAHLETCDECVAEVESLSGAADALMLLAPGAEPPVGFESRVLAGIRASDATARPRRWRRGQLAVAAAVVAVLVGVGWVAGHASSPSSGSAVGHVAEGPLTLDGHRVGEVYAYTGSPSWMFVSVKASPATTSVVCEVVARDGRRTELGSFALAGGQGSWGAALPVTFGDLKSVILQGANGATIARLNTTNWSTSSSHWADE